MTDDQIKNRFKPQLDHLLEQSGLPCCGVISVLSDCGDGAILSFVGHHGGEIDLDVELPNLAANMIYTILRSYEDTCKKNNLNTAHHMQRLLAVLWDLKTTSEDEVNLNDL